ncbi:heavy-metal-associated domain-containing protein [Methanolobus sp.]|uniref:heavy-metal-associated domain-containing protein n=1 Tax=Methanolobus sp. TaxID=1874737 RepID=UPI0025FAAF54|nr:heavy-metal-associated domain-containing protein [Methanolobus sp.]
MREETIKIEGMMCGHCQMSVEKAIRAVKGVQEVRVSLGTKQAEVSYDPGITDPVEIKSAVIKAGYKIVD